MPTHSTAGSHVVDLFYNMGALRTKRGNRTTVNLQKGLDLFQRAYRENPLVALKVLFYLRDIRGGMGERAMFRHLYAWLISHDEQTARRNLTNFGEFGRYDDLEITLGTPLQHSAATVWINALNDPKTAGLAAKWAPRKGPWFGILRRAGGFTSATAFRQFLVRLTKVVETQMCFNEWGAINYEHVPSQANLMYRKAFSKHDGPRYAQFIQDAKQQKVNPKTGKVVQIKAATLFPHQISEKVMQGREDAETLEALWQALPNVFGDKVVSILPVCDVSGSMAGQPMEISTGLGLYLAERNKGPFQNILCTFAGQPQFLEINPHATLRQKLMAVQNMPWEMNTNLEKVFELMLRKAVHGQCSEEDMPKVVLIISDMQFDACVKSPRANVMQMIEQRYREHGYQMPQVVFWNVRASSGIPAKWNEQGVALVSGYSPNIMTSIMRNEIGTPIDAVLNAVMIPRYEKVQ